MGAGYEINKSIVSRTLCPDFAFNDPLYGIRYDVP
jgi:hypothetical protein